MNDSILNKNEKIDASKFVSPVGRYRKPEVTISKSFICEEDEDELVDY